MNTKLIVTSIVATVSSLLFTGCDTTPLKPNVDNTQETKFDKRLIKDCRPLPALVSARETEVQDWATQVIKINSECSTLKTKENAEIKKALNIKD